MALNPAHRERRPYLKQKLRCALTGPGPVLSVAFAAAARTLFYSFPMAQPTALDIDHVAHLARLDLTPEEKATFAQQLGGVLHHIERLARVDVSGVEPTAHAAPVYNVWADDVPEPGLTVEQALMNAPARRQNMIVVPKVVE